VTGHYAVANGTGTIYAGVQMDKNGNPVTDCQWQLCFESVYTGTDPASTGNAGTANNKLALKPHFRAVWTVDAANNIFLQEVPQPQRVFSTMSGRRYRARPIIKFDYASDAYVNLNAGNSVTLGRGWGQRFRSSAKLTTCPSFTRLF